MSPQFDKSSILNALDDLDRKDKKRTVFGAGFHDYKLNPSLPLTDIERFENTTTVKLPEDYRYFISEVGNGGAGPFYGVFKFEEVDDCDDYCRWEDSNLLGDVSKEFPHSEKWNLPASFWDKFDPADDISDEEEDRLMEARDREMEARYWNADIMKGAIPICHQGCAHRIWLVVNGQEFGNLWCDERAGEAGVFPLSWNGKHRVTFSDWFCDWMLNPNDHERLAGHTPSTESD